MSVVGDRAATAVRVPVPEIVEVVVGFCTRERIVTLELRGAGSPLSALFFAGTRPLNVEFEGT